ISPGHSTAEIKVEVRQARARPSTVKTQVQVGAGYKSAGGRGGGRACPRGESLRRTRVRTKSGAQICALFYVLVCHGSARQNQYLVREDHVWIADDIAVERENVG